MREKAKLVEECEQSNWMEMKSKLVALSYRIRTSICYISSTNWVRFGISNVVYSKCNRSSSRQVFSSRQWRCSCVFIINFEHVSHFLMFHLLTLSRQTFYWFFFHQVVVILSFRPIQLNMLFYGRNQIVGKKKYLTDIVFGTSEFVILWYDSDVWMVSFFLGFLKMLSFWWYFLLYG